MNYGYAGKILRVDLSSGKMSAIPSGDYSEQYLGGRGIAARIYWDEVKPSVGALDPENRLIVMTGPLAGFPSIGGSRWQVCAKSTFVPREHCGYSNLGGSWGARLKFAGFDGLVVEGRAERPVYILLEDGEARIEGASFLWGSGNFETQERLKEKFKNSEVFSIGQAGENLVNISCMLADKDSCGSGGLGAIMGSKKLKAIAVRGNRKLIPADEDKFNEIVRRFVHLKKHPTSQPPQILPSLGGPDLRRDFCFGCVVGCERATYQAGDGRRGKFMCQPAVFYEKPVLDYYGKVTDVSYYANKLCDDYGLCTKTVHAVITWLGRCFNAGLLTEQSTGISQSKLGSREYINSLLRMIALKEGFGEVLGRGLVGAAGFVGKDAAELIPPGLPRSGESGEYGPRLYLHTAMLHATEPARTQVAQLLEIGLIMQRWLAWIMKVEGAEFCTGVLLEVMRRFFGEQATDFFSYEGKALAAKMIQDREYAYESFILCNSLFPAYCLDYIEHKESPPLASSIISAITGKNLTEEDVNFLGERLFNLQRAIFLREGHRGKEDDVIREVCFSQPVQFEGHNPQCLVPGKEGEVLSRKGMVVDRRGFEGMRDEYYRLRGWDPATGIPTRSKMSELGLQEIVIEGS